MYSAMVPAFLGNGKHIVGIFKPMVAKHLDSEGLAPWWLRGPGAVPRRSQTPAGWSAGAMARQCSGLTRKGARCSITSTSRLADDRGRLVAEPLQRGGAWCRFHARPVVTQSVDRLDGQAILFFLDLETTGVDVASDQIVELAC